MNRRIEKNEKPETKIHRTYRALANVVEEYPDLTITGLRGLLFIAAETEDRARAIIPGAPDVARALRLSPSGAGRLLFALSDGRPNVSGSSGLGLIKGSNWDEGRKYLGYVLTPSGKRLIRDFVRDATGADDFDFDPHNLASLYAEIFRKPPKE